MHDATNKPSVVSISWGGPEDSWTAQARTQMEQILTEGAAAGVTVTVASGDGGSTDGETDGKQHVDFPASAPHALGCGGTKLSIENGAIASEVVWNELPSRRRRRRWHQHRVRGALLPVRDQVPDNVDTGKPGRGVPDVAGDADPETGYTILVDGSQQTIGGTSAVAPLWAGLIVLLNASLGKPVGFLQPQIYAAGGGQRLSRHHPGRQRRLQGRARMGRVHRQRLPGWGGAVEGAGRVAGARVRAGAGGGSVPALGGCIISPNPNRPAPRSRVCAAMHVCWVTGRTSRRVRGVPSVPL